jgi:MarR family 2-MHQ and catechol resistance regulon transcriptional repressor
MGTHFQGPPREGRALDTYIKLMRAADSVSARIHRHLHAEDLTVGQFAVLEALFHLGPLYQRDLCKKLLKSGGNITMVVDNLEKRGLVTRQRPEDNRRLVRVTLTGTGRRLIGRVFPVHARTVAADFAVLTAEEQEALGRLCRKLGRRAAEEIPGDA